MKHFKPVSPDPFLKKSADMAPAKFGHLNAIVDVLTQQAEVNVAITALAAGGQSGATPVIPGFNTIATAVNPLSSVILPSLTALCACTPCGPIAPVVIVNNTLNTVNVYPAVGESIDGQGVNVPVVLDPAESLSFKNISCDEWQTYNASGVTTLPPVTIQQITDCDGNVLPVTAGNVDLPAVFTSPYTNFNNQILKGSGCSALDPLEVCIDNVTIVKNAFNGCIEVGAIPAPAIGYAEYVQHTQGSNISVAPGTAIEYLTDNPTGVYDTIGIGLTTGPGAIGTAFQLPVGVYMVDYENSADAAWSLAIYQGASNTVLAVNTNTISGASTATTWIHGRAIITSTIGNDWIIISPVTGTQAIPTAGTAAGEFIARLTLLKIA